MTTDDVELLLRELASLPHWGGAPERAVWLTVRAAGDDGRVTGQVSAVAGGTSDDPVAPAAAPHDVRVA